MSLLDRREGETDFEYHKRLVRGKLSDKTLSDIDYSELAPYVFGKEYSPDVARRMMYGCKYTIDLWENDVKDGILNEDILSETIAQKASLRKEQIKLQTEKLEFNKWLRENARDELITDKFLAAISNMEPIVPPDAKVTQNSSDGEYILMFGDEHYGTEFKIFGLSGEILNEYSPEIFEDRMWQAFNSVIQIIKKENISLLHIFSMGDFTDGVLRVGQLSKLRYGVVDGTVKYMEFLALWLNELSKYVRINFQMVNGNHSELRMFNQPKGAFKDENMGKIVFSYLNARLINNENISFTSHAHEMIFANISGYNVLGIHGEVKNMEQYIRDLSSTYNTHIDYLIAGHLHHAMSETVGVLREVIRVPSVVGIDDFSLSLNKTSAPGMTLMKLEPGMGKTIEYSIKMH
ncbi:MAG: hypothetical protein RR365_01070 [Bacteroides sp.]